MHHNSKGSGSHGTDRQNADLSQSRPPVAKKGTNTSAGPDGAFVTEDSLNSEIIGIERQMKHMFQSRGPPTKPTGTPAKPKKHSSSTQSQTPRRPEVQTQPPTPFAQGPPVATATGDRHPQLRTQTNQTSWVQPQQASHAQMPQVPHVQTYQVPHGQTQTSHAQMHHVAHGQTHQVLQGQTQVPHRQIHQTPLSHGQAHQVPHGQMHVSHGQTHQVPHGQMHASHGQMHASHGQTSQPAQVQMHRATEGGTSSHDQQRSADKRRKNDPTPAVTANQRTTAGSRR